MSICKDKKEHVVLNATTKIQGHLREVHDCLQDIEQATKGCNCNLPDFGIRIKNIKVMRGVIAVSWHPMLIQVLEWFCKAYIDKVVITSAYREGSGVHGTDPLRGEDLRSREFVDPTIVQDHCNEIWDYGDGKHQVCVYHRTAKCKKCYHKFEVNPEVGVTAKTKCPKCGAGTKDIRDFGPHFHNQVCDATKRRA